MRIQKFLIISYLCFSLTLPVEAKNCGSTFQKTVLGKRPGFTLTELIVAIGIGGAIMGLLLPAVQKSIHSSNSTKCMNRHKEIGLALQHYGENYNGAIPRYVELWLQPNPPYDPNRPRDILPMTSYLTGSNATDGMAGPANIGSLLTCPNVPDADQIKVQGPTLASGHRVDIGMNPLLGPSEKIGTYGNYRWERPRIKLSNLMNGTSNTVSFADGMRPDTYIQQVHTGNWTVHVPNEGANVYTPTLPYRESGGTAHISYADGHTEKEKKKAGPPPGIENTYPSWYLKFLEDNKLNRNDTNNSRWTITGQP